MTLHDVRVPVDKVMPLVEFHLVSGVELSERAKKDAKEELAQASPMDECRTMRGANTGHWVKNRRRTGRNDGGRRESKYKASERDTNSHEELSLAATEPVFLCTMRYNAMMRTTL